MKVQIEQKSNKNETFPIKTYTFHPSEDKPMLISDHLKLVPKSSVSVDESEGKKKMRNK